MSRFSACCSLLLSLFAFSGCGDSTPSSSGPSSVGTTTPEAPATSGAESEPAADSTPASDSADADESSLLAEDDTETGTLRGVVTFKGDIPEPQIIQATKDSEVCSAGEGPVTDVVVKDGRLAGAVVEITIRGKDNLPDFKTPVDGFVIRQKDCLFSPRLVVAYSGAEFTVHNDDKVEHNVNTGQWNLLQSPGAPPIKQKLNYGGNPFTRVTCNIHSWMESWVYLARSPFYAASNDAGEFVIEGIPVGKKIRGTITHATLGKQRFTIDVEAGKSTEQNFEFEAK